MRGKILTQKEREEAATKGWIEDQDFATKDWIEDQGFATKKWIEDQGYATKCWIESQGYVTKKYLEEQNYVNTTTFKVAIDMLVSLMERQEENFRRYVQSLQEHHVGLVSGMGEVYGFRIEKLEKRVDVIEGQL